MKNTVSGFVLAAITVVCLLGLGSVALRAPSASADGAAHSQAGAAQLSKKPPIKLPDLVGTQQGLTVYGSPSGCAIGTRVLIRNQGMANAGSFVITLADSTSQPPVRVTVPGLAQGAQTTLWLNRSSYMTTTTLTVDADRTVKESDETNNVNLAQMPVPTPPRECLPH